MKKVILTFLFILAIANICKADLLQIPLSCWPKEIQQAFKEGGRKLDLDSSERTKDSWGFLVNKGASFELYTYRSATQEDFAFIQKLVWEIDKRKQ